MTTNRELFHATMAFENGDALLYVEQGFWEGVYEDWRAQGLAASVQPPSFLGLGTRPSLFDHHNTAKFAYVGYNQFYVPEIPVEILDERDGRRVYRDGMGNTVQVRSDGGASLPHALDYAIKSRADYMAARDRLTGHAPERVQGMDLPTLGRTMRDQADHIVSLWVHGPFAFLRQLLGTEMAMVVPYLDPEWTRTLLSDHLQVCRGAASFVIEAACPDICYVWEDSCGKAGPMVSPRLFREFHLPWYNEWRAFLRDMGVRWMVVDTDGDPTPLLPLWLEAGMDCMLPWEVNSVDILKIAREFPNLVLLGGICKHVFDNDDCTAIDRELERVVKPLRARGGYLPSLDHWLQRGVPLAKYEYLQRRLLDYGKANRISWTPTPAG